ncbi:hypothetical protein SAMN05192544_107732 [Paraburkholderia hospita]|nr:hypothetical protein SAMN05192544_107732 [Paraburkholderia hospita]
MGFRTVAVACATPVKRGSLSGRPVICKQEAEQKRKTQSEPWLFTSRGTGLVPFAPPFNQSSALRQRACVLSKHVIAGARQLVRQRLDPNNAVTCAFLALVKAPGFGARTYGEVGRLDKCPCQIVVAVLCVAFAFLPAVAFAPAVHTAAVRTEIADPGKARDGSGFHAGCNSTNARRFDRPGKADDCRVLRRRRIGRRRAGVQADTRQSAAL